MRISDWSSDVCSSDLGGAQPRPESGPDNRWRSFSPSFGGQIGAVAGGGIGTLIEQRAMGLRCRATTFPISRYFRSEEHTSELQSLMRISYSVFCLKKKKKQLKALSIITQIHNNNK